MVKDPKMYDHVWAMNASHLAVEYEIYGMYNGHLHLRHKQGHRTLSKDRVFATLDDLLEDIRHYSQRL